MEFYRFSQADFDEYLPKALAHLSQEISKARNVDELQGLELAKRSFESLFPNGSVNSVDQSIGWLVQNNLSVGIMHFEIIRESGSSIVYLWDFEIFPEHRKKGFGARAINWLVQESQSLGHEKIRLNVFGHNREARQLYDKLGFQISSITMTKTLSPSTINKELQ